MIGLSAFFVRLLVFSSLVIGLVLVSIAAIQFWNKRVFIANSIETTGTVVGYETYISETKEEPLSTHKTARRTEMRNPVIAYKTSEGEFSTTLNFSSELRVYELGEEVPVLYNPEDNEDSVVMSFLGLWVVPSILGGFGSIFLLVGGGVLYSQRRYEKSLEIVKRTGRVIKGNVISVNSVVFSGEKDEFNLLCRGRISFNGPYHFFTSEKFKKENNFPIQPGDTVDIRVDPTNVKVYWVDISSSSRSSE